MARDLEPKWKRCRRERYSLYGDDKWKRRPTLPGQHPISRKRQTPYGLRFREKQKVKRIYGLLERQFRRFFKMAAKGKGNTGVRLLQLLEKRLDNVVYRLGLAPTRAAARQLVNHRHITVNGKKMTIPSYITKIGDEIYFKEASKKKDFVKLTKEQMKRVKVPSWLQKLATGGKVKAEVPRNAIDRQIKEHLIVEFYSR